ncbi:MAG: redoxin domain-containing protein [Lachnospiraceae bacterium]|nr:redoxin domain-containing protein [Lachnospiraceae bacterium]
MNKKKIILASVAGAVLLAVIISIIVALVSCNGGKTPGKENNSGSTNENGNVTYSVSVKTAGGMVMSGIDVYIYADSTLTDLKNFATTDENGTASISLKEDSKYVVALSGIPKGYDVAASYPFDGTTAAITLTSSLIKDEDISTAQLGVGDVMYDFTVTTSDGSKVTLSEVLKEKKMVMLNFWYTTCSWCMTEFPIMAEEYEKYKDDIEIIALDPLDGAAAVQSFQLSNNLPFKVADCPASWANVFGVTGYPTSVFIDRYGVICLVEAGAITSNSPFVSAFEHFTADDYVQKLCAGVSDLVTVVKPTFTMDSSENIGATINGENITVTYRPEEGDSAEYTWPFIIGEKNGEKCIYASNQKIENSYAIIYADVELKKGQALAFDYLVSSERGSDVMYVIVNDEDIFQISGVSDVEKWQSCYPCVADEDGTYELALCYLKDSDTNEGDDTVYIKNMRVVNIDDIDTPTYIPREAATSEDGFEFTYADIVFSEKDGYYHVGTANGPILLANLLGFTQFNEETSIYEYLYDSATLEVNGKNVFADFEQYCNYASNATLNGYCPVTKDLMEYLKAIDKIAGFDDEDENEWMKLCKYYAAYGSNGAQLEDPIKGLATFSAYKATLGKNISSNFFYYDRAILPRGLMAEFVPTKSGVYRITSRSESQQGVNGWIFDENRTKLLEYEHDERMYEGDEVSMVFYMEAGKSYYIDIAFWDVYEVGTIEYDIEYVAATYELFRLASPGYFTYDSDATGEAMYHVIAGGINVVLGADGIWYEDLGNGKKGSKLYVDFTGITGIFSNPIMSNQGVKGMIEMGGFDFSKTENDMYVLSVLESNNNDKEAAIAYLKETWGDDYDEYVIEYHLDDVLAGIYHGTGKDYTSEIEKYTSQIDKSGNKERNGCVVATKELTDILQLLMDKYTFENVDNSWTKLCYYYDYLGPEK